jgi:peptidoglycan hydrolase CwlO-like protein
LPTLLSLALFFGFFVENILAEDAGSIQGIISDVQKKLNLEEQKKKELEAQLNQIQTSVNKTQQEINKTQYYINEAGQTISRKENEINNLNIKIDFQKKILASLLREMFYVGNKPITLIILDDSYFSQFMGGFDHLSTVKEKVRRLIEEIKSSKDKIEDEKSSLKETRQDHESLLSLKQDQQQDLLGDKKETQTDIKEKEATIAELNAKLYKLRSNLSGYLGKSYDAKDIEDAAKFASKVSGVRKDFIMGMLVVESDLGRFTGGCYAKDSRMSGRRLELFKDICDDLDYEWKKRKVSCPPSNYSGTGGAMGVAQFMSDTWMGYKSQIASVTGHNPPDPWNLTDGVTAMGLKLARGGATKRSGECNAAKLYLSGTTSSKYNWYCDKVKYWADNYERLLN